MSIVVRSLIGVDNYRHQLEFLLQYNNTLLTVLISSNVSILLSVITVYFKIITSRQVIYVWNF
jgi:hypothetical protein